MAEIGLYSLNVAKAVSWGHHICIEKMLMHAKSDGRIVFLYLSREQDTREPGNKTFIACNVRTELFSPIFLPRTQFSLYMFLSTPFPYCTYSSTRWTLPQPLGPLPLCRSICNANIYVYIYTFKLYTYMIWWMQEAFLHEIFHSWMNRCTACSPCVILSHDNA